jgi:low affinity Fe/Cu permease
MIDEIKNTPDFKIHKENVVYGATFFGGPLAAGYIIAENFKAFGDKKKYTTTLLITTVFTIVLFSIIFLIPAIQNIPHILIPIAYTSLAYALVKHYQGKQIDEHITKGGKIYSVWRSVLIAVISLITTIAIIFSVAFLQVTQEKNEVLIQPFHSINHELNYNPNHITKEEIKLIGEELAKINFLDSTYKMYLYLDKEEEIVKLSIPFSGPAWNDTATTDYYNNLETILKTSYQKNIEVQMCDTLLNVKKTFK